MKKYSLLISTAILCTLFLTLTINYSSSFKEVSKTSDTIGSTDSAKMADAISTLDNINKEDAGFITQQIIHKLEGGVALSSLYDLNKRIWQVPSSVFNGIDSLSPSFKKMLSSSRKSLGQGNEDEKDEDGYKNYQEYKANSEEELASKVSPIDSLLRGAGAITVKVYEKKEGIINRLLKKDKVSCEGILVRLSEHYMDSLNIARRTLAWAKTNSAGIAVFDSLNVNKSYSVLPIRENFEYGSSKGTTKGSLAASAEKGTNSAEYFFVQQEHKIRMFDAKTLSQIKENHTLTVRALEEYRSTLLKYLILFFGAWWGLYLLRSRRHKNSDDSIIAILMLLTGLCLLSMFSINDPLEDKLLGVDMAQGVIAGVVVMGLLQFVDFTKLYQNRTKIGFDIPLECISWIFKPFRKKVSYFTQPLSNKRVGLIRKIIALFGILLCLPFGLLDLIKVTKLSERIDTSIARLPKGSGYLITALLLTALLWTPFGSEVGGMKVNLNFGIKFQPSEIAKYLIVFFMAAFFSLNANKIMKYSNQGNIDLFGHKLKMLAIIIVGLGLLMGMYLVLGDMGPALVLAFTFILLYSIVKSKVDLKNLDERSQNIKILTCDLAMLTYGAITFIAFLYIGRMLGNMPIFCLCWFVLWIGFGVLKKQLFESAILFNLIISAFIFGGTLLCKTSIPSLNKIGERLESRKEMCTNTWGTLPIDGTIADAGENTQVADGLWGLASGGLWGQGLGNGSPHFIPAFHTDMILESIGEQLGFIGIFVVILLLALLLRKSILLAYRTSHPFAFYLCLGISIVTAVQFIIIALGSTGIIPLTGVTVPFLSYGKVSMILNLAAFGIILSYDTTTNKNAAAAHAASRGNIRQYNYSVSVLSWLYCGIALLICCVFFHYQFTDRNATLIKPVYAHNADGAPVVEYNPRIAQLTDKMWAGDIYDRNGILLATSDKSKLAGFEKNHTNLKLDYNTSKHQKRYYPFGKHLAFMLGKYGSDIAAFRSETSGYAAEYRHMCELRGYDNKKYDSNGNPLKVTLISDDYKPGRFYTKQCDTIKNLQLRDYSALIPYLKAGYNSDRVAKFNARNESFFAVGKIKPQDIYLTVDAKLQTLLQQEMSEYIGKNHSHLNKLRVSVVILDAHKGDLLSSAIYPLPDEDRLREEQKNGTRSYRDVNKPRTWHSYSDMDLGLIFPSAPGSTAKVLTGLAGFRKYKDEISEKKYYVDEKEIIFEREPSGRVLTMKEAYRYSSNCYFIHLLNDNDLFEDLASTYGELGISIGGKKSYGLQYDSPSAEWLNRVTSPRDNSVEDYKKYIASGEKSQMNEGKPTCWGWSWGQYGIDATPLAMARAISVVANRGKMPKTRFLLSDEVEEVPIIENSKVLSDYLKYTAREHDRFQWEAIGGKTGTPERATETKIKKRKLKNGSVETITNVAAKGNDGWYICFIDDANIASKDNTTTSPLAIAIRMERLGKGDMSGNAVRLMKNVVKETLRDCEYIK